MMMMAPLSPQFWRATGVFTDWLNMMYPRLKLAKDLMADDGVIFISIDDCEAANLTKIGCEVFGVSNFITDIIWEKDIPEITMRSLCLR